MKTWDKRPELQVPRYPENLLKTAAKEVSTSIEKKNLEKYSFILFIRVFQDQVNIQ
jgi:hypothetical protein